MFPVAWASAFVLGSRHQVVDDHQKGGNHNAETRSGDYICHAHLILCLGSLGPAYSDFNHKSSRKWRKERIFFIEPTPSIWKLM